MTTQVGSATGSEGLICFVCDIGVVGRYYTLANCRTQTSKVRLIEKLGQLVGDEYMVVISQEDIICRGCATMINSLDRLEKELGSLRSIVLRYLEKKYEMPEGELVNTRGNSLPISSTERTNHESKFLNQNDFQGRKRKTMMMRDHLPDDIHSAGKDASFLQCDKCKYTTNYGTYMAHHARTHMKKKMMGPQSQTQLEQVSQQTQQGQGQQQQILVQQNTTMQVDNDSSEQQIQNESKQTIDEKPNIAQVHQQMAERNDTSTAQNINGNKNSTNLVEDGETVEMIAAEIEQDYSDGTDKPMLAMVGCDKPMTLHSIPGEDGKQTLCMVDENGIIIQRVEQAEDGTLFVRVPDGTDPSKQMMQVAEDGSVQMVEVLWGDDMVPADETENPGMVTF